MRSRRSACVCVLILAAVSLFSAGCSRKPKVATEAAPPVTAHAQVVPETPVAPPDSPAPAASVDYENLDPGAYGIADAFFPFNAYAISEAAMAVLEEDARIMKQHPTIAYLIEGHCDERGTVEYNMALGEKRAKAARDYLVSLGVPVSRLKVVSYGEERPFANGHDESAWAQNRRAHFARP